ncbi:hypothetical protein XELAEV_18043974mg [Xenopus laevis]|uniref:Uncharacterized protein n=1 Tax=Xenopus laevis TaxID=8355 RepID=A0A974H2W5_XENLA|nr:hypothetical protein XELAEV_18043974mg [Xenopus laevis]
MNTRWQEISTKCSFDLMILTIECLEAEITSLSATLVDERAEVARKLGNSRAEVTFTNHSEILSRLRAEITERKRRKFQRDIEITRPGRNLDKLPLNPSTEYTATRKTREWNEPQYRGDRWQYCPSSRQNRESREQYTTDSSQHTSTEAEAFSSDREAQPFLGVGPGKVPLPKRNPRYPISREAYPQRNSNSNNRR